MEAVRGKAGDRVLLCQSDDGQQLRWMELHDGTRTPRQVCPFVKGRLEGEFRAYHKNGRDWINGRYAGGELAGTWTQWDDRGEKVAEGEYRLGQLIAGAPVAIASGCQKVQL
jgi:hypothetical protein